MPRSSQGSSLIVASKDASQTLRPLSLLLVSGGTCIEDLGGTMSCFQLAMNDALFGCLKSDFA